VSLGCGSAGGAHEPSSLVGRRVADAHRRRTVAPWGAPVNSGDPDGIGNGRLSCAVVHVLSTILALSLDPKEILNSLSPYGEIGLMLIIFAETGLLVGFFLPGDSLLFTAGILANQGKLNLAAVLVGCFAAAVIGDQVGFTIGERLGPRLLRRPDSRLFKREYIDRTEDFFDRHGAKTILLARFVPVVRTFAPVVAGVGKMTRRTFVSFNVVGAFIWVFGVTLAGYALAEYIGDSIDTYLYPLIAVIILVSLIPPFLEWRKAKKQEPRSYTEAQVEAEAAALHEVVEED
jgi:membrane-associated protein